MDKDEDEILWRFYQDHMTHVRHHETLRATTSTVLLAVAAGVLGLLGAAHAWPLEYAQWPLCVFLILLGGFGALFSAKYHERVAFYLNRADEFRNALDKSLPNTKINTLGPDADAKTGVAYEQRTKQRLWRYWVYLHVLVAVLGAILTASIFWPPGKSSSSQVAPRSEARKPGR